MATKKRKSKKRKASAKPRKARPAGKSTVVVKTTKGTQRTVTTKKNPQPRRSVIAAILKGSSGVSFFNPFGWQRSMKTADLIEPETAKKAAKLLVNTTRNIKVIGVFDAKTPPAVVEMELLKKQ